MFTSTCLSKLARISQRASPITNDDQFPPSDHAPAKIGDIAQRAPLIESACDSLVTTVATHPALTALAFATSVVGVAVDDLGNDG